ncbi:MAG TPA: HEAT repeat domain-containing protein [Pyrinomonadaceae bacterium]|nr:HEAT repeat domain-containing protein [Pyrinomonadaceae bacterium]
MRIAVALCFVFVLGATNCKHQAPSKDRATTSEAQKGSCFADGQLSNALRDLASGDPPKVDQANSELLNKSKLSAKCRTEVVAALMQAMDKPNLDSNFDSSNFYLWRYGAEILGDLKAAEALDLLISHLNLHDPVFGSPLLSNHPAQLGVITMGPIAIPKLGEALKHNGDPKIRYAAIYCIANIGGQSAVSALKEALVSESDECAKRLIQVSLDSFDEKGNIKNTAQWFGRFKCK